MTTTGVIMTGTMITGTVTMIVMIADTTISKEEENMKDTIAEGPMFIFQ